MYILRNDKGVRSYDKKLVFKKHFKKNEYYMIYKMRNYNTYIQHSYILEQIDKNNIK